jgi:hypothetical protein
MLVEGLRVETSNLRRGAKKNQEEEEIVAMGTKYIVYIINGTTTSKDHRSLVIC